MRNFKNCILIITFLLIPIFAIGGVMYFNDFSLKLIAKELLFNSAILVFIILFTNLINQKILKNIVSLILLIPFYSILFIKIFTLLNFFNFIDNAVLYTVFETNYNEAKGFFNSYSKWYHVLIAVMYIFTLTILIFKVESGIKLKRTYYIEVIALICVAISYRFYERSLSLLVFNTYLEYKTFSAEISKDISKRTSKYFTNVTNNDEEALYVVIIGESTTRNNMGIYGYYRDTNPNLNKIKNELHLFKNVISPHIQTILSLDKILSMGDYQHPESNKLGTIIQLANQAGFETYWLSNQKPIGAYESLVSLYAKASKNRFYVSNIYEDTNKYDEILLPKLKETINKKASKKMIFLHLEGSHISYHKKYPENFNFFTDEPQTQFKTEEAHQIINEYDNSIRYNDFIVSQIIETVKNANKNSYVIYFSDHGEEVFKDYEYFGHHESIGSNAMFEIPFIIWTSDRYKEKSTINFSSQLERKYNLEDFIYSFSDLSRIKFDQFQPTKSIFNTNFQFKKRIVLKDVNYDERIKEK
ncbi:heptose-I-phosphate ethanolaminephosphotransferase [Paenimyroides ummariense]|uniref:Heptose-I-phosphate ethanolaminephosphotransferase n=2 Tax=Paenimyroides ummariense TaxID=913024 RepID=A0A1I4XL88_9FLAO|nr:heptose-I-phosphate ethanolaminephosphotransferase [Paenimyroides ummariense]